VVVGALAGDDEVVRGARGGQSDRVRHEVDAVSGGRTEQHQGEPLPAGSTRAGLIGDAPVARGRSARGDHELVEDAVDDEDLVFGQALLRPERLRGAEHAEQRRVDVDGSDEGHSVEPFSRGGEVDASDAAQAGHPFIERDVGRGTERPEQACSTVIGGAAAQPDHDGGRTGVDGRADRLTDSGGGRVPRIRLVEQLVPAGLRRLDERSAVPQEQGDRGRSAQRPGDGDDLQVAAERVVQDVDEAGTAVGHRQGGQLVVCGLPCPPLGDGARRLRRGERAGERVRRHQHLHRHLRS
jgi:hypothetical protein